MRLSWLPVSEFSALLSGHTSIGTWLDEAATLGFTAVDASVLFFDQGAMTPEQLRRGANDRGLGIAVLNTYTDFTHPDPHVRDTERARFEDHMDVAARLGARMIRVTAGQAHPELSRDLGVQYAVDTLTWAAERALSAGVRAVFENHSKPGVWSYADFAHPADIFLEIAAKLAAAPIGILFDTANADARSDDALAILDEVAHRVECVHIADTAARGELRPTLIGAGVAPLRPIFSRLSRLHYNGWFSIEENSGDSRRGIRHALSIVRKLWEASPCSS